MDQVFNLTELGAIEPVTFRVCPFVGERRVEQESGADGLRFAKLPIEIARHEPRMAALLLRVGGTLYLDLVDYALRGELSPWMLLHREKQGPFAGVLQVEPL